MDNLIIEAENILHELVDVHENYFTLDREGKNFKLKTLFDKIEDLLNPSDGIPFDEKYLSKISFIRGKACNCIETLSSQSEALLTKAVKLDPKCSEAWTTLGICLWKKNNRIDAKSCFIKASQEKPYKEALRELSILTRQIPPNKANNETLGNCIEDSIKLAKQAISLDMNDHMSWYVYGNAHCTRFFTLSQDFKDLEKSLSSYKKAEGLLNGDKNPDLYFNRGNVQRHLQQYDEAVESYSRAQFLDPNLTEVIEIVATIKSLKANIIGSVNSIKYFKGNEDKEQKMRKISRELAKQENVDKQVKQSGSGSLDLPALKLGPNTGVIFMAKLLQLLTKKDTPPPACYLCVDSIGTLGVASIYNVSTDVELTNQIVTIRDPFLKELDMIAEPIPTSNSPKANKNSTKSIFKKLEGKALAEAVESEAIAQATAEALSSMSLETKVSPVKLIQVFNVDQFRVNGKSMNTKFAAARLKIDTFDA